MTPLQEACLAKLKATSAVNMEFFRKNLPDLYLKMTSGAPEATVDISDQGDLSIRYPDGTSKLIAQHYSEMEKRLLDDFSPLSKRPQIIAFQDLRKVHEGTPGHGRMQRYHYSNLDAEYPNQVRRHFTEHYPGSENLSQYPDFGGKRIPILIVVGCGYGWHLQRLLMEYDIRHMIVLDTDEEAFRLSTFFQDYAQLTRLANEKNTSLSFVIEPDVERLGRTIVSLVQVSLPPYFVHGASIFYASHDEDLRKAITQTLPITLWQLFFGLGYFDDELISIKHTLGNLQQKVPIYTKSGVVPADAVAFIIGSGPSLDDLLPLLREYHDRAVLFSCGTALGPLSHAGVVPDFHVEKERPFLVSEVISETVPADFRKAVNFIGVNVIHPPVFEMFKSARMVLKSSDTGGDMLRLAANGREKVFNVQPTVTNAALNIAIGLGFKKIYLVGVDLGYLDKTRHHSLHTVYLNKMPQTGPLQKLFNRDRKAPLVVRANFGGVVHTTSILNMSRITMESDIAAQSTSTVFNLNQGAYIEGATPLPLDAFSCDARPEYKAQTLDAVFQAFEIREYDPKVLLEGLLQQVDVFVAELAQLIEGALADKGAVLAKMIDVYKYVFSVRYIGKPMNILFRGSILHILAYTYQMLSIIEDEGEAAAKAAYDFGVLLDHLHHARAELAQVLVELSEGA